MRVITFAIAALLGTTMAQAQQAPAPVTQPATAQAAEASPKKVMVLPFEAMGGTAGNYDWIGRAVQQNLVTDLARLKELSLNAPAEAGERPAADVKQAVEAGKAAGADYVVFGSFQLVDPDLRLNGLVVSVQSGETVVTLKSTGTVRDLFAMEDTVASQAKRALVPPTATADNGPPVLQLPTPVSGVQPQTQIASIQQQPPVNGYLTDYNRYTYQPTYPYYGGYGYGYGYGGYYPGYAYWPGSSYGGWSWGWSTQPWISVNSGFTPIAQGTSQKPVGIGTDGSLVARAMISVTGNFRPDGSLRK